MKVFFSMWIYINRKTTTVEGIIKELKRRTIQQARSKTFILKTFEQIPKEAIPIDIVWQVQNQLQQEGFTRRIFISQAVEYYEIQAFYDVDYLVIEGMCDANIAHILTGKTKQDLENKYNERVFMISGKIADTITEYKGLPAISIFDDPKRMVDLIEEKTFELLPDFDEKCCGACGMDCRQFCASVIHENRDIRECVLYSSDVQMKINGQSIEMVPFVQKILKNAVIGVASELDGWTSNGKLEITIGRDYADR